jgi:hypothetical protein
MKTETLEFTKTELDYLYNIVDEHIRSGEYWGNREQFQNLQKRVLEKIEDAQDAMD